MEAQNVQEDAAPFKVHFGWRRKVRPRLQSESSECGLACLVMIAEHYGAAHDLRELRRLAGLSSRGMNGADLLEAAYLIDLQACAVRVEIDELRKIRLPAILHFDMNHCVVLEGFSGSELKIIDPAVGRRALTQAQVSEHFTGVAFLVEPGVQFKPRKSVPRMNWTALTGRMLGLRPALAQILGLAILLELLALASPLLMQTIVDKVLPTRDHQLLVIVGASFASLLAIQSMVSAARSWAMVCLGQQLSYNWVARVYTHLVRLPDDYFSRRHLGDVVTRFDSVLAVQQTLTTRVAEVLLDGVMGLITLALMIRYSGKLSVIAVAAVAMYALLRFASFRRLTESNVSEIAASAKQQSSFIESVRGITTLRLFNQQATQSARYMSKVADTMQARATIESLHLAFGTVSNLMFGVLRIGVILLGATIAMSGEFSTGMLVAFAAYSDRFATKASSLVDFLIDLKMLRMHGERITDITSESVEGYLVGKSDVEPQDGSLEFRGVSFRYSEKDRWIVKDCSFLIESGKSACIVGASGVGKSTLLKLACGLLDPEEGQILFGGIDIRVLGKSALRRVTGVVLQDDTLFAGTLRDNITFFEARSDADRVVQVAEVASISDDVETMPMRYETLVGDMGSTLSGGQRQRLLIARALYRQPQLLLLDEATSHLDAKAETAVLSGIASMGITRMAVAHRQETVRLADHVLLLQDLSVTNVSGHRVAPLASASDVYSLHGTGAAL